MESLPAGFKVLLALLRSTLSPSGSEELGQKGKKQSGGRTRLQNRVEQIGHELLARARKSADFFDLPLQFWSGAALAVAWFFAEQTLDGNLQSPCERSEQGGRKTTTADLVGTEHRLGNPQGLSELDLRQPGTLASQGDTLTELTKELSFIF
jgi:hypothetical protein